MEGWVGGGPAGERTGDGASTRTATAVKTNGLNAWVASLAECRSRLGIGSSGVQVKHPS
jgi:hypothetical protein